MDLLESTFRANPTYDLVAYDRLPASEQARLADLAHGGDFYGVLVGGQQSKAVDPETALLVLSLRSPGRIPTYVRSQLGAEAARSVAELVLDEVLEIETPDGFVSGPAAQAHVFDDHGRTEAPAHPLGALSQRALQYAEALDHLPHEALALRLYHFNALPITASWRRRLRDAEAVTDWLQGAGALRDAWERVRSEETPGWISWRLRGTPVAHLPYKLYISPLPDALPDAFFRVVRALERLSVPAFKIGADAAGVLRPDKFVAYVASFSHLADVGRTLQGELRGIDPQGVPFTAPIDEAGLLSWGMDPPASARTFAGDARASWRHWVTQRLATALVAARNGDAEGAAWRYALDRLRLERVDTNRWVPDQAIWQGSPADAR